MVGSFPDFSSNRSKWEMYFSRDNVFVPLAWKKCFLQRAENCINTSVLARRCQKTVVNTMVFAARCKDPRKYRVTISRKDVLSDGYKMQNNSSRSSSNNKKTSIAPATATATTPTTPTTPTTATAATTATTTTATTPPTTTTGRTTIRPLLASQVCEPLQLTKIYMRLYMAL